MIGQGPLYSLLRLCVHGVPKDELPVKAPEATSPSTSDSSSTTSSGESSTMEYFLRLVFCILGLQVSYITWGLLQVRILKNLYGVNLYGYINSCIVHLSLASVLLVNSEIMLHVTPLGTDHDSIL